MKHTLIIAEAGVNHNGSLPLALKLVEAAAYAGADIVKFQTFKTDLLTTQLAPTASYQIRETGVSKQYDMIRGLELTDKDHQDLYAHSQKYALEFLSTAFDLVSLDMLIHNKYLQRVKIPSGEVTNGPLLLGIAQKKLPIIMSTGMANIKEIKAALGIIAFGLIAPSDAPATVAGFFNCYSSEEGQQALKNKVTLLHCTTEYPASSEAVNLKAMDTLRGEFGLPIGYSDHTMGIEIALAAVARGAEVIEKHITLDKSMPGPDHKASLEPDEFKSLVEGIRSIERAMGDGHKVPHDTEQKNIPIARRSLVAAKSIEVGEKYTIENLSAKRPGTGVSPMEYWMYLGTRAKRSYSPDENIDPL